MSAKRLYFVQLAIIVLLGIGLVAATYGVNKVLTARTDKLVDLKAQAGAATEQQTSLVKAKSDLKKYAELKQIAQTVVPEDKNQAEIVRQIVNIASQNSVSLASVTFPASTLGAPTSSGGTSTGAATVPTADSNPNSKNNGLSQLQPVKNIPGVYSLLITVQSNTSRPVSYGKFISFLNDLETNRRTSQVTTITLSPKSSDPSLISFTLTLNGYIKP